MPPFCDYSTTSLKEAQSKGGSIMSTEDRKVIQSIAQAVNVLPNDKREFILGYAEGVIAMAAVVKTGELRPNA